MAGNADPEGALMATVTSARFLNSDTHALIAAWRSFALVFAPKR